MFFKMLVGIQEYTIQYIGMVLSTNLISTNLPTDDKHRKHHTLSLCSNLLSSQFQSAFLYEFGFRRNPRYLMTLSIVVS